MTVALVGVACGGSGTDYSAAEQQAIDHAEQHVEDKLDEMALEVSQVSAPDYDGDLWRVELDTDKGYRCVYMTSEPDAYLDLLTIKSGFGCASELLYDATSDG